MAQPIFIVDLEATCWDDRPQYSVDETEIIEIGCVLATPGGMVLDEFSTFVRPVEEPVLSRFCTRLTSIPKLMLMRHLSIVMPCACWMRGLTKDPVSGGRGAATIFGNSRPWSAGSPVAQHFSSDRM